MTTVLHDDKKARLRLIITDARAAQLLSGKTPAAGVEVTTEPHDSLHWGNRLVRLDALKDWLDDAKTLDERSMRWKGAQYAEALRFGRRVLVCAGENNARNLQSVGLTFEEEAEAKRFFTSFATVRPKGWVDTGSVYVEGKGGISREYLGGSAHSKRGVHAAIVRVLDEVSFLTTVDKKGKRTEKRTVHVNEAAALAALNAFELAWYREGGRQHEIEFMKTLLRRKDRTLLDWAAEEVPLQADPVRFTRKLLQDARLDVPARLPSAANELLRTLRTIHAVHWLRVGEQASRDVVHHEVENRRPPVHVYLDEAHLAVAEVTVDARRDHTWAEVKRAPDPKKYQALVAKTLKRFALG